MGTGPVERPSYGHCARNLFKWIKQHLKVKRFIGRSKNAVWTQLWIATCMYLLLAYLKFVLRLRWSLNQMLQVLQLNIFERRPLHELFTHTRAARPRPSATGTRVDLKLWDTSDLRRTAQSGLGWPLPAELDDAALEARLFRRPAAAANRARPDCAHIHRELKRHGVTLQLLWEEYLQVHPLRLPLHAVLRDLPAVGAAVAPSMRQVHRAGESLHRLLGQATDAGRPAHG